MDHLISFGAGTVFGSGITVANPGPFINVLNAGYWSGTAFNGPGAFAWIISPQNPGGNSLIGTFLGALGWAVHDGDVAALPEPTALTLVALGLVCFGARRREVSRPLLRRSAGTS